MTADHLFGFGGRVCQDGLLEWRSRFRQYGLQWRDWRSRNRRGRGRFRNRISRNHWDDRCPLRGLIQVPRIGPLAVIFRYYCKKLFRAQFDVSRIRGVQPRHVVEEAVLPIEHTIFKAALTVEATGAFGLKATRAPPRYEVLKGQPVLVAQP